MSEQFTGLIEIQTGGEATTITLDGNHAQVTVGDNGRFGVVNVRDANGQLVLSLEGDTSSLHIGNDNSSGTLHVYDENGQQTISLLGHGAVLQVGAESESGDIRVRDGDQREVFRVFGHDATVNIGTTGNGGDLRIRDEANRTVFSLNSQAARLTLGANDNGGALRVLNSDGEVTVRLDGDGGNIRAGGTPGADGDIVLFRQGANIDTDDAAQAAINAVANGAFIIFRDSSNRVTMRIEGEAGNIRAGGAPGVDGDLVLFRQGANIDTDDASQAAIDASADDASIVFRNSHNLLTIWIEGEAGNIRMREGGVQGANGGLLLYRRGDNIGVNNQAVIHANPNDASIVFRDLNNGETVRIDGENGNLMLGGNGHDGDVVLYKADSSSLEFDKAPIHLNADTGNILLGGNGTPGDIWLFPSSAADHSKKNQATVHLDAEAGDITLSGADCAENFEVAEMQSLEAGTVMVIDDEGKLCRSTIPYDRKVVGVISGAGDYRPGIVLHKQPTGTNHEPIALVGKVFCKVTADKVPIEVGDLLTTADIPGHAMKATDSARAFGAVIGKALKPLGTGCNLIPILISLQ